MSSVHLGFENKKEKGKPKKRKRTKENESDDETILFLGDQSLAQSCRFLYDATVSREVIYATAEGDIGRVWEAAKVCEA
jgi:hypothetical protein